MFFKHKNSFIYAVVAFLSSSLIAFFVVFSLFYYSDIDLKKDEIYIKKGDSLSDVMTLNVGICVFRSNKLCNLIPPFERRNFAQSKTDRHKSIMLESKA